MADRQVIGNKSTRPTHTVPRKEEGLDLGQHVLHVQGPPLVLLSGLDGQAQDVLRALLTTAAAGLCAGNGEGAYELPCLVGFPLLLPPPLPPSQAPMLRKPWKAQNNACRFHPFHTLIPLSAQALPALAPLCPEQATPTSLSASRCLMRLSRQPSNCACWPLHVSHTQGR